jgi:hypothetical protein
LNKRWGNEHILNHIDFQINQLKKENAELKNEIEAWKKKLVEAEVANGVPQIPPPVRG